LTKWSVADINDFGHTCRRICLATLSRSLVYSVVAGHDPLPLMRSIASGHCVDREP